MWEGCSRRRQASRQSDNCPRMPREAILESPGRHKILEKSIISLVHIVDSSFRGGGEGECVASKSKTGFQIQEDRVEGYKAGLRAQGFRTEPKVRVES